MYSIAKNFWKIATAPEGKLDVFHIYLISCQDYDIVWLRKLHKTY